MNWKIGQKLVCVESSNGSSYFHVKCDDIVTFNGYGFEYPRHIVKLLEADPGDRFLERMFRPLLGDSAKAELISSFTEIKEGSDLPIRTPQPETV